MHVSAAFIAHAQATELMESGERPFDNPAMDAQAAAVRRAPFGQHRFNPTGAQGPTVIHRLAPAKAKATRLGDG